MDVQMEDASPIRAQERNASINAPQDTPNQSNNTTPALPPISSLPSLPSIASLPPAPSTHGVHGVGSQPLAPFPSTTSASAPIVSTSAVSASAAQPDPAKLEAIRKATLNSYKNRFLNLRDKFDRVNAVSIAFYYSYIVFTLILHFHHGYMYHNI